MLEILQFVFSSGWVFLGTAVLLSLVCGTVASMFKGPLIQINHVTHEAPRYDRIH